MAVHPSTTTLSDYTVLMGANTYRLMSGFASSPDRPAEEADAMADLTRQRKVVFSSTLETPLAWANTEVVRGDAVEAVAELKQGGTDMSTIGSLTLCRSLLEAGVVDLFRVGVFPVITGKTGRERIYDGYPDVALDMVTSRTFDSRIQLLERSPRAGPIRAAVAFAGPRAETGPDRGPCRWGGRDRP